MIFIHFKVKVPYYFSLALFFLLLLCVEDLNTEDFSSDTNWTN